MASAQLFGLSSSLPGHVFSIDESTGNATHVVDLSVGPFPQSSLCDIEFQNGVAYACDVWDGVGASFGTVDLQTGVFTTISHQEGSFNWYGLASKESDGLFYVVNRPEGTFIQTFAKVTTAGVYTPIAQIPDLITGLTYDSKNDVVYGTDGLSLFSFNQVTGAETVIGSHGFVFDDVWPQYFWSDIAYDTVTDTLYGNFDHTLYTIDRGTGLATPVGNNNQGSLQIDGLGFRTVPEPGSLTALGLGALALLRRRRR